MIDKESIVEFERENIIDFNHNYFDQKSDWLAYFDGGNGRGSSPNYPRNLSRKKIKPCQGHACLYDPSWLINYVNETIDRGLMLDQPWLLEVMKKHQDYFFAIGAIEDQEVWKEKMKIIEELYNKN